MDARAAVLIMLVACDGASPDPGRTAQLQIDGAQFRPGPFPTDAGGPPAIDLQTRHPAIVIGELREPIDGTLDPAARAAAIGIEGEDDAWILVAGPPDIDTPGMPSAKALVGLAHDFEPGLFTLVMAASDEAGRFGAPVRVPLVATYDPPPDGTLVIELGWRGRADLDIHVVDANGGEAWSDDPNTFDPPIGEPVDPNEFRNHGILDHDGNKDCRQDGNPSEHVVWSVPPPAGEYTVRVDTPSLCGDASAAWHVAAWRKLPDGSYEDLGTAVGVSTPDDVLQPRGRGAGVLALRFSL